MLLQYRKSLNRIMPQLDILQWKELQYSSQRCQLPVGRWGHKLVSIGGNRLLMFGGFGGESSEGHYLDDIWVFDATNFEWEEWHSTGPAPSKRSNYSLHYNESNQEVLMFGGGSANRQRFGDVWVLSLKNKRWRRIDFGADSAAPWERTYHVSELRYPYLIVQGGEAVANMDLDDTWVLHLPSQKWKKLEFTGQTPAARRFHGSVLHQNWLYIFGGCHENYKLLDDVHRVDLSALFDSDQSGEGICFEWQPVSSGTLLNRWGHSCLLFEGRVYIWGGRVNATKDANDLLVFDPADGSVRQVKTEGSTPSARRRHSAVVVGRSLLVFGGYSGQYYNDFFFITLPGQTNTTQLKYSVSISPLKDLTQILRKHEKQQKGSTLQVVQKSHQQHRIQVSASAKANNSFLRFLVGSAEQPTVELPNFTTLVAFRSIVYALETRCLLVPEQATLSQKVDLIRSLEYFGCGGLLAAYQKHLLASPEVSREPQLLIELTEDLPVSQLRETTAVSLLLKQQQKTAPTEPNVSQSNTQLGSPRQCSEYVGEVERGLRFEIRQKVLQRNSCSLLRQTASRVKNMILGEDAPEEQEQLGCWKRMLRAVLEVCGSRTKSE